jgi:hypothetical protein
LLPKELDKAYDGFYDAVTESKLLDTRTRVFVRLAAAMAFRCPD